MDDLTDHGVTIGDEVYTRITLRDKKNLIPAALKDLVNKPGKVLAIKDAFTDFVTDKENDPIFKYVNDYEDYDGKILRTTRSLMCSFGTKLYQISLPQEIYIFRKPFVSR